jgi:hypothetical protein
LFEALLGSQLSLAIVGEVAIFVAAFRALIVRELREWKLD